jgi:GNAT superfamily N-acetyltransferase
MDLRIERVVDEQGASAFHALENTAVPIDHPGLFSHPLDDIVGMLPNPMPSFKVAYFLGLEDRTVVATGFLGLPQVENTHTCNVHVLVEQRARRRGVGSQMLRFLIEAGRQAERRLAIGFVGAPIHGTAPGNEMAAALGATAALGNIRRELRLDELDRVVLEGRVTQLSDGSSAAYKLFSWGDRCPDHLLDGAAAIQPRVMSDSPRGELDMEDEVWDGPRYREHEAMLAARRRHALVTAALERATGELIAYTDLHLPSSEHRVVDQQGTVVEPEHRGHRLGLLVKTQNLVNLLDAYPDAETVQTYNAVENEHMIAVNEALGFRAVERTTIWQLAI